MSTKYGTIRMASLTPTLFYTFKEESTMITWNNLDTLEAFKNLSKAERVNIAEAMSGENGAERCEEHTAHRWQKALRIIMLQSR